MIDDPTQPDPEVEDVWDCDDFREALAERMKSDDDFYAAVQGVYMRAKTAQPPFVNCIVVAMRRNLDDAVDGSFDCVTEWVKDQRQKA